MYDLCDVIWINFTFVLFLHSNKLHSEPTCLRRHICAFGCLSVCCLNVSFFLFRHHYIFVAKQMKDKTCVDCKKLLCTWKLLPLSDVVWERESTEVFLSPHSKRRTSRKQDSKVNSRELVCCVFVGRCRAVLVSRVYLAKSPGKWQKSIQTKQQNENSFSLKSKTLFVLT